jgi:hypothetical protein
MNGRWEVDFPEQKKSVFNKYELFLPDARPQVVKCPMFGKYSLVIPNTSDESLLLIRLPESTGNAVERLVLKRVR